MVGSLAILAPERFSLARDFWYYAFDDTTARIEALQRRYGVQVEHEVGPDFLPAAWMGPPAHGAAAPIDAFELSRVVHQLPALLGHYPERVLRANLRSVRLSRTLELFGAPYGGTSFENHVYLTSRGRAEGYTAHYLALLFHHEFSSVLMRNHAFPTEAWLATNPPEVRYAVDVVEILGSIAQNRDMQGSDALYRIGLLAEYAMVSIEDDVNLYAEVAFVEPSRLAVLAGRYPVVRAKTELLQRFYLSIDRDFAALFDRILPRGAGVSAAPEPTAE